MKTTFALALTTAAVLVLLPGCDKPKPAPTPAPEPKKETSGGNPLTAPVDYLGAAAKAKKSMDAKIELVSLTQGVQQFYAGEGRFPKTLQELVEKKYMTSIPTPPHGMKISYDAASGEVKITAQ